MVFKCTNRSLNLDHAFYGTPISLFRMMQCILIQGWFHITLTHENIWLKVVLLIWFYLHRNPHSLRTICHSDSFFLLLITLYYLKFDILRSSFYNIHSRDTLFKERISNPIFRYKNILRVKKCISVPMTSFLSLRKFYIIVKQLVIYYPDSS